MDCKIDPRVPGGEERMERGGRGPKKLKCGERFVFSSRQTLDCLLIFNTSWHLLASLYFFSVTASSASDGETSSRSSYTVKGECFSSAGGAFVTVIEVRGGSGVV